MNHRVKPGDDDLKYVRASRLFEIRIGTMARYALKRPSFRDAPLGAYPESRDSGLDAEPVIGPRYAPTRWHAPE
jgi:hypothetical protein